jgi:tetratricopeptide (TPR) repeat protein
MLNGFTGSMSPRIYVCVCILWASAAAGQSAARTSCPVDNQPAPVKQAYAALDRDPTQLEARLRLADRLVDQACYSDAVNVLTAGQALHPRSVELAGKLRDVRSILTEQTYIQGLTQAEDAARQQRSQLRCTKLGDLEACGDALKVAPNDASLVSARADALMQVGRAEEAATGYQRALQLSPSDETLKAKLAAAISTSHQNAAAAVADTKVDATAKDLPKPAPRAVVIANAKPSNGRPGDTAATAQPPIHSPPAIVYSNDAPEGRSN